jgi:hypothetical protein
MQRRSQSREPPRTRLHLQGRRGAPLAQPWRTALREWRRLDADFGSSFEAVCLFSFLGIVLTLLFLHTVAPVFDIDPNAAF